jgi:hypothetical protein
MGERRGFRDRWCRLLRELHRHHDWLVVIALVVPEELEPELLELVEPEEPEPELPELVEAEEAGLEPVDPEEPVVDAGLVLLWASAGSCPDTSWKNTTPQIRANVEVAAARVRFRIKATRRRRAFSRAVTPLGTAGGLCSCGADVVVGVS